MTGDLRALLRHVRAFSLLSEALLDTVAAQAEWVTLPAGGELFAAGQDADALYVVTDGRLRETRPGPTEALIAELGVYTLVGDVPLVPGGRRSTTARALVDARLLRLPRAAIVEVTRRDAGAAAALSSMAIERLRRDRFAAILAALIDSPGLEGFEDVLTAGEWEALPQGQELVRQGERADAFWILVNGLLGVSVRTPDGERRLVNRLYRGEVVGEMALLTDDRRSATVFAIRDSELVRFPRSTFFEFARRHPAFLQCIAELNITRLRQAQGTTRREAATLVVSLVGTSGDAPLPEVADRLAAELSTSGRVLHVTAALIDRQLDAPGAANAPAGHVLNERVSAWLTAQQAAYAAILLEADHGDTQWTRTCVHQSDQVLIVARAAENASPGRIDAIVAPAIAVGVPVRLVLIHPDAATRPERTSEWLATRKVDMHHHVRLGRRDDMGRLARFLTGHALGLALGGGGARALAHIGVLRAFREAGIVVDMVAGTSMGAIVGAQHAMGLQPEDMVATVRDMFQRTSLLLDLTLPLLSVATGRPYVRKLRKVFGRRQTEDLWIPFLCVSSNISRARMVVHDRGVLWKNLRASTSVQGLLPPVVIDGDLHVDGALFSNLPADVLKSRGAGHVIAVDVTPPVDLAENTDYGEAVSGSWILSRRLFGGPGFRVADIRTVLLRAAEAVSTASQKQVIEKAADYYLRLPVDHIGQLNFNAIDELERIGHATATERIPVWRATRQRLDIP